MSVKLAVAVFLDGNDKLVVGPRALHDQLTIEAMKRLRAGAFGQA